MADSLLKIHKIISQETQELIDKLLLEKLPLAGVHQLVLGTDMTSYEGLYCGRYFRCVLGN